MGVVASENLDATLLGAVSNVVATTVPVTLTPATTGPTSAPTTTENDFALKCGLAWDGSCCRFCHSLSHFDWWETQSLPRKLQNTHTCLFWQMSEINCHSDWWETQGGLPKNCQSRSLSLADV